VGVWGEAPTAGGHRRSKGRSFQPPEAWGSGGKDPSAGRFLQFFNKIKHFYAYFGQNNKAITYQLKAFEKQSKRTKSTSFVVFV